MGKKQPKRYFIVIGLKDNNVNKVMVSQIYTSKELAEKVEKSMSSVASWTGIFSRILLGD